MAKKTFNLHKTIVEPTVVPYLLAGDDAPEILAEFNDVVDRGYKGNSNLKVLQLRKANGIQTLVGSNPLILPVVGKVIAPKFRIAKPEEVETTLQEGDPMHIQGNHYVDYGLVLDFSGRNHDLAVSVFQGLPKEFRDFDRLPGVLVGYGLANSEVDNYGVAPTFEQGTELKTAKILSRSTGNFNVEDSELTNSGLPSKLGSGNRTLYTTRQQSPNLDNLGLQRLYLSGDLSVDADDEDLAGSGDDGRVASVVREAARKNSHK